MVVDCAPSADSLRLLTLPDVLEWYSERIFGPKGTMNAWMRRRMARTLSLPVPGDELVDSVNGLSDELSGLRSLLRESATTARIVVTPERVVVAEAQRTLTYLALYGYATDAVLVNRVAGAEFASAGLDPWLAAEESSSTRSTTRSRRFRAPGRAPDDGTNRARRAPPRRRRAVRRGGPARDHGRRAGARGRTAAISRGCGCSHPAFGTPRSHCNERPAHW